MRDIADSNRTPDQRQAAEAFSKAWREQGHAVACFADLAQVDETVRAILKMDGTAEECCVALYHRLQDLAARVIDLEAIAPRKFRLADGRVVVWRCPDTLVPDPVA